MRQTERISLRQSQNAAAGYTSTFTFPPAPATPNQNAAFEQTILNRGYRGFKLVVVVQTPGSGSLTPIVNECTDSPNTGGNSPESPQPNYSKIWGKSTPIVAGGVYILEVYPGLTAASGANDVFNDVLGYKFNVVLQHNNANPMTYDAYLDLIP